MEYDLYRYQDFQNQRDRNSPRYSYSQPQQQQSPMNNMQLQGLDNLFGAGTGGETLTADFLPSSGAIQGAGSSSSSGAGAGSSWASLGPWAALAAAVIGNETAATDAGRRAEGDQYYQDLLTGKVLSQDADYYADKAFGSSDNLGLGSHMKGGAALLSFQPSKAWDHFKEGGLLGLFS